MTYSLDTKPNLLPIRIESIPVVCPEEASGSRPDLFSSGQAGLACALAEMRRDVQELEALHYILLMASPK